MFIYKLELSGNSCLLVILFITIISCLYSFWNFQMEYSRLSYFWHITEHLNFLDKYWRISDVSSTFFFFLGCALILYKERRFSYEHLCTLSFFTGLLKCFINSGIKLWIQGLKLWDQKLQFKGLVSEILLKYFWGIFSWKVRLLLVSLSFLYRYAWLVTKCKRLNKGFMSLGVGLIFRLSSVLCLIVIRIRGGERGRFSRAGLYSNKII